MVARLAGEVSGPDPVLHDQHAISVEAPHDRPAGTGTKAPLGDPRLVLENFAEGADGTGDQVERIE